MPRIQSIEIDLDQYLMVIGLADSKAPLVLRFDTPSRRFYLSVIALVAHEMKKEAMRQQGEPRFIDIRRYKQELKQLDESISGRHASKDFSSLLSKIRVAWRNRLPDLEAGALFKIQDRDRVVPYEKGGKYRYLCSESECDAWANLFRYDDQNKWRFKFAMDTGGLKRDDISFVFEDLESDSAWNAFMARSAGPPDQDAVQEKEAKFEERKKTLLVIAAVLMVFLVVFAIWKFYPRSTAPPGKISLPDKPSIAVLPFTNLDKNPRYDYFCDGLTEELITSISKIPGIFVVAQNSMFTYKGRPVNVKQVAREMGVRYVLEGSVRTSEGQLRVTAQLVDALNGYHLWAERYDRVLENVFALQDELTMKVVIAFQIELTEGEKMRSMAKSTDNMKAYLKWTEGRHYFLRLNRDDNTKAQRLLEQAIDLDPEFPSPYVDLGWTHIFDIRFGLSRSPKASISKAWQASQKAIELDPSLASGHLLMGAVHLFKRQYSEAIAKGETAVSLNPGNSKAAAQLGRTLAYAGRHEDAIKWLEKAIQLDPRTENWILTMLGHSLMCSGRYEEAIEKFKRVLNSNPADTTARIRLTAVYGVLGRRNDANFHAREMLKQNPAFRIAGLATWPIKNKEDRNLIVRQLRKTGLPE